MEFYPEQQTLWKLKKAMYGLKAAPRAWQDHYAKTMEQLGATRLVSAHNIYRFLEHNVFVMAYVDDLLFVGSDDSISLVLGL